MKKGLVLEGGAMRGMFTAGVLDALMENGIELDGVIGVSAGAAFGCNYKSGQNGRALRYNTKYVRDKRYCGMRVLMKTGDVFSADFCYNEVPLRLDPFDFEAFEKSPVEFYVVCTDLETGEAVYKRLNSKGDNCLEWIRASASMPLVSNIVEIDGQKLLDGGIADSIPVGFFQKAGFEKNVVVLTRPKGYRKSKNSLMTLVKTKYSKYPNFIKAMDERHTVYNRTLDYIEKCEAEGTLLVIRPPYEIPVKRVERDPKNLELAHALGKETAIKSLDEIKSFLK